MYLTKTVSWHYYCAVIAAALPLLTTAAAAHPPAEGLPVLSDGFE